MPRAPLYGTYIGFQGEHEFTRLFVDALVVAQEGCSRTRRNELEQTFHIQLLFVLGGLTGCFAFTFFLGQEELGNAELQCGGGGGRRGKSS